MAFPSPCHRHLGACLHVEIDFPVGSRFLSNGSQCSAPLFSLLLPEAQGGWEGLEHGWALWFLPEKWRAFALPCHNHLGEGLHLRKTVSVGSRLFAKGSQGRGPRVSLRLPKAQGRGEGLRPCLGNVVSSTWVCGILLTWLPPLGIGFPRQAPIVRRKPFLPQGSPGCVRWG